MNRTAVERKHSSGDGVLTITNQPRFVAPEAYRDAIDHIIESLREAEGVLSIYQLGSVGAPGISDIDVLVIFEDDVACTIQPYGALSDESRYLCTHGPFGVSYTLFRRAQKYSLYHDLRLCWGPEVDIPLSISEMELGPLKVQVALEFLVSNFIARRIEQEYGIVSMRNVLLSTHAIRYDLDFLGVTGGDFYDMVAQLINWRNEWFDGGGLSKTDFSRWFIEFCKTFEVSLDTLLHEHTLYMPPYFSGDYARHIEVYGGPELRFTHKGCIPSPRFGVLGKKYVRLLNRINRFRVYLPYQSEGYPSILRERFEVMDAMKMEHAERYPNFLPFMNSLLVNVL